MELAWVWIFLLSIIASFIQRTIGFGFGMFILTVLPFLMPSYGEATALSGLLALSTSFVVAVKLRGKVSWRRMWVILLTFTIISVISIFTLRRIEDHYIKMALGVVMILTSIYFAAFSKRIHLRPTPVVQVTTGILSGLMGGFFGMQGPPAVLYFISSEPTKEHYIAMTQWYFLLGNGLMTLARAGNGFVTKAVGIGYAVGIGGVLIGTFIGSKVFEKIPSKVLSYLVYAYIGLSGIFALITA